MWRCRPRGSRPRRIRCRHDKISIYDWRWYSATAWDRETISTVATWSSCKRPNFRPPKFERAVKHAHRRFFSCRTLERDHLRGPTTASPFGQQNRGQNGWFSSICSSSLGLPTSPNVFFDENLLRFLEALHGGNSPLGVCAPRLSIYFVQPFIKLQKNKAYYKRYQVKYRRRRG